MRRNRTYRHDISIGNFDIYILSIPYFNDEYIKIKYMFAHKKTKEVFTDKVYNGRILRRDVKYWKEIK